MRTVCFKSLSAALLLSSFAAALPAAEPGGITVQAVQISETRGKTLVEQPKTSPLTAPPRAIYNALSIRLRFSGSDVANATHKTLLELKTAGDDTGNSLLRYVIKQTVRKAPPRYYRITRAGSANYETTVALKSPKRGALSIKELSGKIALRIATDVEEITIPITELPRNSKSGTAVETAELKKADLPATLSRFTSFEKSGTSFAMLFEGKNSEGIFAAHFVDKNGKQIGMGFGVYARRGKVRVANSYTPGLLPPTVTGVKIRIARKTKDVVVPIQLKDIPLP